ncbi:hypothetical protein AK812_SmicGene17234 [Symbiodinium microadriaticum]|uniref:Uncharacterized protein n=1 Tax=Symbiodinium microadriaticum TaxID=2951 RepID=A0A1Q9DYB6_SYMMI|nr:hypothetical protein AK812_SmicGene17234 [Symbiodinium microadriaticum]
MLERLREFRSDLPELLYADEEHRYDCFAAQTWKDKELVVIDTGPRSSPFLKAKALEALDAEKKRNLAIACASGATIAHFDDDARNYTSQVILRRRSTTLWLQLFVDFYAPEYLTELIESMQGADAVTLASWFVGDACTGLESWILGYGFSYVYRRAAALRRPFQHEHFGEVAFYPSLQDYQFLVSLRDAPGGRGIRTDAAGLARLAVAKLPGLGAAHRMFLRPCLGLDMMVALGFQELVSAFFSWSGDAAPGVAKVGWDSMSERSAAEISMSRYGRWQEKEDAVVCYCVWRRKEVFMEPGRAFAPTPRLIGARLPSTLIGIFCFRRRAADSGRGAESPEVAEDRLVWEPSDFYRHVGRLLLTRCPATRSARSECEGWIRLQVHYSTHIALLATLVTLASLFPRVRLEVEFEEEAPQRQQELLAGSKCGRDLRV